MPALIHLVAGARPNLMKIAPLWWALRGVAWARTLIVHTGQHADPAMGSDIMTELDLPAPHIALGVAAGSHGETIGRTIEAYDRVLSAGVPDIVVVVGDVHATLACAVAAMHRGPALVHLEAGLRSYDRTMPEERNRVLVDHAADLLLTTDQVADANLAVEGIDARRIVRTGDVTIDTLEAMRGRIAVHPGPAGLGLEVGAYVLATLHRPGNVDDPTVLAALLAALGQVASRRPVLLPLHPRTRARIASFALAIPDDVRIVPPQSYIAFQALLAGAACVITDSGGLQEETSHLGIPCLTLRANTERPLTVMEGTNRLVDAAGLVAAAADPPRAVPSRRHDGRASLRAVAALRGLFG